MGLSFLEKGGKALLLGSVFPGEVPNLFLQIFNDLTGLDRAWWFCHHVNTFYIYKFMTIIAIKCIFCIAKGALVAVHLGQLAT